MNTVTQIYVAWELKKVGYSADEIAANPRVSAPRQPACPHCRAGYCLPISGKLCRGQPGLYRSHIDEQGIRKYLQPQSKSALKGNVVITVAH